MTDASELWWHGQREFCANPACRLHVRADSSAVRGGGFPPLMLDPVDFVGLYRQNMARQAEQMSQNQN